MCPASRQKGKLNRSYNRDPILSNMILFKVGVARSRRINRRSRKQYFRNYTSTVNSSTPLLSIHKTVLKVSRKHHRNPPAFLSYGPNSSDVITSPGVVTDDCCYHFASFSSTYRYPDSFCIFQSQVVPPDFFCSTDDVPPYNHLFMLAEFRVDLAMYKDVAP